MSRVGYIAFPNQVDAASLYGGSWGGTLSRLRTRNTGEIARSVGTSGVATVITVDLGSARSIGVVAIGPHNLSPSAQWRIKCSAVTAGATDGHDSGVLPCWYIDPRPRAYVMHVLPRDINARYLRIELADELNPDGLVEAARLFVGAGLRVEHGDGVRGYAHGISDPSDVLAMDSGSKAFGRRLPVRSQRLVLPLMSMQEGDVMYDLMLSAGLVGEVLWAPDASDPARSQRYGFLGTFRELSPIEYPYPRHQSLALHLEEFV